MTQVVCPVAPQFISLTEAEVLAALDDPNTANPIAVEVARLIAGYGENFRAREVDSRPQIRKPSKPPSNS